VFTLSLFQILLISGFINALILFFTLSRIEQKYRKASLYLGLFIVGYLLYQVDLVLIPAIQQNLAFIIPGFPVLYVLPVLLFFFVMHVFYPSENHLKQYKWLFIPSGLDILYTLGRWIYVQEHQSGKLYEIITGRVGFFTHEGGGILFSLLILAILLRNIHPVKKIKTESFIFFKYILAGLSIIMLRWMLLFAINVSQPQISTRFFEQSFMIFESAFLFYIGYKILQAPGVLNVYATGFTPPDSETLAAEANKLRQLIEDQKLYLQAEVDRSQLAELAGHSEAYISVLINDGLNTTFYKLINDYRVREAIRLIEEGRLESITVEALAAEAGFKSKSTFYSAFKKTTGQTPLQYNRQTA